MHEPPAQCSRTRSALPQDALCAEGAVLSPVPMQLPAGALLTPAPTKRHGIMIICRLLRSRKVILGMHHTACIRQLLECYGKRA